MVVDSNITRLGNVDCDGAINEFMGEVRYHRSYYCSLAFDILRDYYVSEEVVQETFVRAWQKLLEYETDKYVVRNVQSWMTVAVRHVALDYVRRKTYHFLLSLDQDEFLAFQGSRFDRPDMVFEDGEGAVELDALLGKLPKRYRIVIVHRWLFGVNYGDIAKELGCEVKSARVIVHRATKRFAQVVKEEGISEFALRRWLSLWHVREDEEMWLKQQRQTFPNCMSWDMFLALSE